MDVSPEFKPVDSTDSMTVLSDLLTKIVMRIMVREGHGKCLIDQIPDVRLEELPKSIQIVVNLMERMSSSSLLEKLVGAPMYLDFDLSNPEHLVVMRQLRQMLDLERVPTLFSLAAISFFKAHKDLSSIPDKTLKEKIFRIISPVQENTTLQNFPVSIQSGAENETHVYNPLWVQHFPELYVLNHENWFYRRAQADSHFPSPRRSVRYILPYFPWFERHHEFQDFRENNLSDFFLMVLLEGSQEQIKTLIQIYLTEGRQDALNAMFYRERAYSPLLLVCLRNIFDKEILEKVYNRADINRVFNLHEPVTCLAAACYHGNFTMFHWLTEKGEKLEHENVFLLDHAIRGEQTKMCEYLVNNLGCKLGDVRFLFEHFTPVLYRFLMQKCAITQEQIGQLLILAQERLLSGQTLSANQEACMNYLDIRRTDGKYTMGSLV